MSEMAHQILVIAGSPGHAEEAARWVDGDGVVVVDPTTSDDMVELASHCFDGVTIRGDLADTAWVSRTFDLADRCLRPGGLATVVLADAEPAHERDHAPPRVVDLPDDVAVRWRTVSMVVEHPRTAITFARAADDKGTQQSQDVFRHAQAVSYLYRHPELASLMHDELLTAFASGPRHEELITPDDELAVLRHELAAYRNSKLGRITTKYWELRRSFRRRRR